MRGRPWYKETAESWRKRNQALVTSFDYPHQPHLKQNLLFGLLIYMSE
jgi:hypothetical protein